MSALNRQSHATNDAPLWASSSGGFINGSIVTTPEGYSSVTSGGFIVKDPGGNTDMGIGYTGTGDGVVYCRPGNAIKFAQIGSSGNSEFIPSAQGANLDYLNIGGAIGCRQLRLNAGIVCGTSAVLAGQTTITINSPIILPSSLIFLTLNAVAVIGPGNGGASGSLTAPPSLFVNGTSFTVQHVSSASGIITAPTVDCTFNWMIINFV